MDCCFSWLGVAFGGATSSGSETSGIGETGEDTNEPPGIPGIPRLRTNSSADLCNVSTGVVVSSCNPSNDSESNSSAETYLSIFRESAQAPEENQTFQKRICTSTSSLLTTSLLEGFSSLVTGTNVRRGPVQTVPPSQYNRTNRTANAHFKRERSWTAESTKMNSQSSPPEPLVRRRMVSIRVFTIRLDSSLYNSFSLGKFD